MKATDYFKQTIQNYLELRAESDTLFAPRYHNLRKSIDDCITYILNEVRRSGCNGFADDEIYSMALHYYNEEDIDVGKPINCKVVVNHTIELTEEEKQQAHEQALRRAEQEAYNKLTQRKSITKKEPAPQMAMLF